MYSRQGSAILQGSCSCRLKGTVYKGSSKMVRLVV